MHTVGSYPRRLYRDDAVVLRVQKLGEADRIVTLFTRRHGRVRAVGKGVRRTTSRFGARLEPFGHVDVQIVEGRSLHVVAQVEGISLYGKRIIDDYPRYTAASAIAETAERLTHEEGEPALRLYLLTLGALRALGEADDRPAPLILDSYLLRAMALSGWQVALTACAVCGRRPEPGQRTAFSVPAGGTVCATCRPPGAAAPTADTLDLMVALSDGDWRTATASASPARRQASGLIAALLQWHLERALRSLPLVDRS
jgi:DNA repair protein RecO (recombination protein O)